MTESAQFDRNTLAAVKPGVDGSLAEISSQLELYLGAPAENGAALEAMRSELHRLLGVLKMVGLNGVAVFCAELELTLSELAANPKQVSAMHRDVLRRALFAVTHYLDTLANGADNAALRLFPQYQELQQLRGLEMSFELDLFYPNLDAELPEQVLSLPVQGDAMGHLKTLRNQYQQNLLKWLRQDDTALSVQLMQQAVEGALRCVPQDGSRAFWWIAYGLLDCLKLDGLPPEMNVRKLLGRIDQQMRATVEGNIGDVNPVLNEMLFLIGHSHAVSEHVEAIKQVYSLDQYLPDLSALSPGEVDEMLGLMRDQLRVAEESWEQCAQGDGASCEKFIKYAEQIALQSDKLDRDVLQYLAKQIQVLSQYASSPEHARPIAMDMAMALLLMGSGIENYRRIGINFQEQARILSERMQAAVKQQPEDTKRLTELVDLHYQMEQRGDVMGPLASEMLVNLQRVEQGLNAFFNNAIKRDELSELLRLLNQIQGGLRISSLSHAEKLLASIQDHVGRFINREDALRPAERYALADAMSALENYMQYLTHGQAGDVSRLKAALAEMAKLDQAPEPAAVAPVEPPKASAPSKAEPAKPPQAPTPLEIAPLEPLQIPEPAEIPAAEQPQAVEPATDISFELPNITESVPTDTTGQVPESLEFVPVETPPAAPVENVATEAAKPPVTIASEEDQELLDIFLEEALEVLNTIRANLETCQLHPDSHESLVSIRRGFHTLKGSGRMVGLTDLGEVAWCVERAMNKWLQDKKSATPGLLELINAAVQSFAGWVDTLGRHEELIVKAEDLIAAAQQVEDGLDSEVRLDASTEVPAADLAQASEAPAAVPATTPIPAPTLAPEPEPTPESIPETATEPVAEPVAGGIPSTAEEAASSTMALFNIASAEVKQNIAVLHQQLGALRTATPAAVKYDFMRAAHTLAGVSRTMGFAAVVDLASALEEWLQARVGKPFTLNGIQLQMLDQSIVALDGMIQSICDEEMPHMRSDLVNQLLADKDNLSEHPAVSEESISEEAVNKPEQILQPEAFAPATMQAETEKSATAVAGPESVAENVLQPVVLTVAKPTEGYAEADKPRVFDDVDEQLLPVFLEEAEDLCPKISETLRAWREPPHNEEQVPLLKRLLHTMKGSARMVGAMRIGEIAHDMEDRVLAAAELRGEGGYWDALENDFDRIMALIEELHGGKPAEEPKPVPHGRRATDQHRRAADCR